MPKAPQPSDQLHVGDYLVTACERETTFRICTTDFNGASWGLRAQGRNSIYEPIKRSEWMMSSISRRLICKIATVVGRCLRFCPLCGHRNQMPAIAAVQAPAVTIIPGASYDLLVSYHSCKDRPDRFSAWRVGLWIYP